LYNILLVLLFCPVPVDLPSWFSSMSIVLNSDVELVSMLIKFEELIGFVQYSSIDLMPNSWIYVCLLIINSFQITFVLISCCVYTFFLHKVQKYTIHLSNR
jgi:hypothetical protein